MKMLKQEIKIQVIEGNYKGRHGALIEQGTFSRIDGKMITGAKVDIGCAGYLILQKGTYIIK